LPPFVLNGRRTRFPAALSHGNFRGRRLEVDDHVRRPVTFKRRPFWAGDASPVKKGNGSLKGAKSKLHDPPNIHSVPGGMRQYHPGVDPVAIRRRMN